MRGEIELNLGGKLRPLKFGTNQTARYCEIQNSNYEDYFVTIATQAEKLNPSVVRALVYSGLYAGTKERDFDLEDVGDWIDDLEVKGLTELLTKVFECIARSIPQTDKKKG